ncbi:MAG: IS1182 family transposase [Bacteroidales bacterium]|jgi:transposase|nr:IS1182 family transposase [Bacteroidales bacterium]
MPRAVFKPYSQGQVCLFPRSLDEKIAENAPVRLVSQIVDNLDISEITNSYKGGGSSSYNPRMLLKLILFSYLNNIYSCRKIEKQTLENIHYMWLTGMQEPDHNTINLFRSSRLKDSIHKIFTQIVLMLVDMGYLSLDVLYVDGTKLESRANRYTFVWRKKVEKNKAKLEAKILMILKQVEEGIAQDNQPDDEPPKPINSKELKERIAAMNREQLAKEDAKAVKTLEEKHLPKLQEYEKHLKTLNTRNSYSKTDSTATFMRLKDDHMQNGQLKPAYNLQIGTENQFIIHFDFFSNCADFFTLIPFHNGFKKHYQKMPAKVVADSGYGSEENYEFMQNEDIEAFVKYPMFHAEQKKSFKNNPFIAQNLFYNKEKDYFVCPMGQHMENMGTSTRESESGYKSTVTFYEAKNCNGCTHKSLCHKAKGNRRIEVNHKLNKYRKNARQLLTSEDGLYYRSHRSIEPEAVFGQTKTNKQYNRFRHFGLDMIKMDFGIFATAFNLGKLWNYKEKTKKKVKNHTRKVFIMVFVFTSYEKNRLNKKNTIQGKTRTKQAA